MWFPTVPKVIDLHDRIIDTGGGDRGILHRGSIDAAIHRARFGPFPGRSDLAGRAAMLLRGIAQDHPFVDGNKRTAFELADLFLEKNGSVLVADEDAIVSFMLEVARGETTVGSITRWIRARMHNR